jgi:hypothetical protein
MKKSSVLRFTRKCLKAGYKTQVCRDAWIFGKTPDKELKQMFADSFAKEKVFVSPHSLGRRSKTLKLKTAPKKLTKKMMLSALGPRFASSI